MSRDMQIGLLLAVGFLALVGGVLYYRIEHPDELEQFLGGNETQAAAAGTPGAPDTSKPDTPPAATTKPNSSGTAGTVALNTNVPPAAVINPPALDTSSPFNPPPLTSNPPPVVQTSAPATAPTLPAATNTATASNDKKHPGVAPVAAVGTAGAPGAGSVGIRQEGREQDRSYGSGSRSEEARCFEHGTNVDASGSSGVGDTPCSAHCCAAFDCIGFDAQDDDDTPAAPC
ncbi:MAG: hypothetical protein QM703_18520 [Gemmatales bacterium]